MADAEILPTNGDVDQSQPQSENDVEESMEVQTIQTICSDDGAVIPPNCPKPHKEDPNIPYDECKLFLGGLHTTTTTQTLHSYFSKYGDIEDVNLKIDNETSKSKGFAFIKFKEEGIVDKILEDCPHSIDEKYIDLRKAIPHEVHQQLKHKIKKIFVGGVPISLGEKSLREYFQKFGEIAEVALVTDKTEKRNRRGFCFVSFKSETSATKACEKNFHDVESFRVEVKLATPRENDNRKSYGGGHNNNGRGGGSGRGHPFFPHNGRGGGMHPGFAPYGGHAGYYPFFPAAGYPNGAGFIGGFGGFGAGYGGYGGPYEQYGGGRRDDSGYISRYGPSRYTQHHNHSHGHSGSFHPYSR